MHSNTRLVISFGITCIGCIAIALLALPATAGTNSWTAIGPVAYPFAVDPSSPSTIYSVVNGNAVTKTTDGGGHWADLATLDSYPVNSLAIDPASPDTIYAAQGEPWDLVAVSIYKSIDGGAHWAAAAAEFTELPASVVAIAPSLSSTLYAGVNEAVFKSVDGGLFWAMRSNGLIGFYVSALAIDPTNADVVYVAQQVANFSGPDTGKIFKSTDGGGQWRQVPIPVVPDESTIMSLAIDRATPSVVYAAYAYGNAGKNGGVFKSSDSGETWIAAQSGLSDANVFALAIDPSTPARIYAATNHGVFTSTDAAASWTPINSGLTSLNVWSLSVDRTGSLLRAATDAGLFEYQVAGSPPSGTVPDMNQYGLTGSWYDAATSGQGIEVEMIPSSSGDAEAFVSWFTYDTVAGGEDHQRWYTGLGPVVNGQYASLQIFQNTGGNFDAPPTTDGEGVGTATLSFDSCTSGHLAYTMYLPDGTRTGNIPLARLTQNVTCSSTAPYPTDADFALSGNWFFLDGQGFTVEVNPNSGVFFAAWYTYAPNGAAAGLAGQRWYTALGTFTRGLRSIPVTIYETTGGIFDMPTPAGQQTVAVGTGTMEFLSCTEAVFNYNFTGGSNSGLSSQDNLHVLSRLTPVPLGCTS